MAHEVAPSGALERTAKGRAHLVEAAPPSRSVRPPILRAGTSLFVGTLLANVLSYGFLLLMTRHLRADEFGAVSSLVNLITIFSVGSVGLQLVGARRVALARSSTDGALLRSTDREVMRLGWEIGAASVVALLLAAAPLGSVLRIDTPVLLILSAAMVPVSVTASVQGVLQGEERFGRLSAVLAVGGLMKFLAGVGAMVLDLGVVGVTALLTGGWFVTAFVALLMLPRHRRIPGRHTVRSAWRHVWAATVPTSGLLLLSSLDVLLARHHLSASDSGSYAVGAIFEKAAFWGLSFVGTLFYPQMARAADRYAALRTATLVCGAVGVLGVLVSAVLGGPLARVVGGASYVGLGSEVWLFTALGVCLSLSQVFVYAALAGRRQWVGPAVWATCTVAIGLVQWAHASVGQVALAMVVATAGLAAVTGFVEFRSALRAKASTQKRTS